MTIFKASPKLVKIVIVQKSYWFTIFGPLSVWKCQKLVFCESEILHWKNASQNSRYVFFMKVTVDVCAGKFMLFFVAKKDKGAGEKCQFHVCLQHVRL
jgi:hypothetical protein